MIRWQRGCRTSSPTGISPTSQVWQRFAFHSMDIYRGRHYAYATCRMARCQLWHWWRVTQPSRQDHRAIVSERFGDTPFLEGTITAVAGVQISNANTMQLQNQSSQKPCQLCIAYAKVMKAKCASQRTMCLPPWNSFLWCIIPGLRNPNSRIFQIESSQFQIECM